MADTRTWIKDAQSGLVVPIDLFTQADGDGRQAFVLGDASQPYTAAVTPWGGLDVDNGPTGLIGDTWDSIDTAVWTTAGTVAPSVATGVLSLAPGTAASAWSAITSVPTFRMPTRAALVASFGVRLEAAASLANNYRFFGFGVLPTTPTAAAPVTNGVGFELDTTGALNAVVWAAGTRTLVAALTKPVDGNWHSYAIYYRTSTSFFVIDNVVVATASWVVPAVQTLPTTHLSVNGTTAPTTAATLQLSVSTIGDMGRNGAQIEDGTYPFRKARVLGNGAQVMQGYASTGASVIVTTSGTAGTPTQNALAADPNRVAYTIYNDGTALVNVGHGFTVSTTAFNYPVYPKAPPVTITGEFAPLSLGVVSPAGASQTLRIGTAV